jgi:hypothetical protein
MANDVLKLDKIMGKKGDTTEDDEIDIDDLSLPKSVSEQQSSKKRERVSERSIQSSKKRACILPVN